MDYMMLSILTKDKATVDVKGECTLKDYEDHIEVLSYSHGVSLPVQAGTSNTGRTTGHPNFGELSITKQLDSTTPAQLLLCPGEEPGHAQVEARAPGLDECGGRAGAVYDLYPGQNPHLVVWWAAVAIYRWKP